MRQEVAKKFNNLSSEKTDWQYCKVEKLIQEKQAYDKMCAWKKLETATVNKFDSFTGEPFDMGKKEEPDEFGRFKESTKCSYDFTTG